jgi:hypothetical protein
MQDTILSDQVGISVLVVFVLQWLKNARWFPWVAEHTTTLNRVIAFVIAVLTSIGFQFALVGNWQMGGTLTIQLPSAGAIFSVITHSLAQAGIQEGFYQSVVKPEPQPVIHIKT